MSPHLLGYTSVAVGCSKVVTQVMRYDMDIFLGLVPRHVLHHSSNNRQKGSRFETISHHSNQCQQL